MKTLFIIDDYFPERAAPAVRIRSFVNELDDAYVVGGCRQDPKDSMVCIVDRPSEKDFFAFSYFLLKLNAVALYQTIKRAPKVTVLSIPKYELLLCFPFLRLFTKKLVLDVRDSVNFINYSSYFAHFLPLALAKPLGAIVKLWWRLWLIICVECAHKVTCANKGIKELIGGTRTVVISNGVNTELFVPKAKKKSGFHVAYVGNFAEKDRFDWIIPALEEVPATLHLVGRGRNKDRVIKELKKRKIKVVDHGFVDHKKLPKIIDGMHAGFIFRDGEVTESIPVAIYEFSSMNIPSIANGGGLLTDFMKKYGLGYTVTKASQVAGVLRKIKSSKPKNLHAVAKKEFSRKKQAKKFKKLLDQFK
jgi:glycosyltransferase involved in cell wall biosynthesis